MATVENAMRRVGQAYGKLPHEVGLLSLGTVVDEYLALQEVAYQEAMLSMRLTEAGVMRALATLLSGKPLPEPEADSLSPMNVSSPKDEVPGWWVQYQRANPEVKL